VQADGGSTTTMNLRLVFFFFLAGVFLLIGVALTKGVPPNHLLGVRTPLAFSSFQQWQAINGGAGILMMAVSYLAFYGIAARADSPVIAFAVLLAGVTSVAMISASAPDIPSSVYSLAVASAPDEGGSYIRLIAAFGVHLLVGSIGFLMWREKVAPNRFIGLRMRPFTDGEREWYRGNRIAGAYLFAGSAVSVAVLIVALVRGVPSRHLLWGSVFLLAVMTLASWLAAKVALTHDKEGK
jgi:uncharacterized membrane protein